MVVVGGAAGRIGAQWREYHDPEDHDRYVEALTRWLLVAISAPPRARGVVLSGPLAVDLDHQRVLVNGFERHLTPVEWLILGHLARNLDAISDRDTIVARVWPDGWGHGVRKAQRLTGSDPYRALRVHLNRLRSKLGPAADLVETHPARGYRLRAEPPVVGRAS